MYPTVFQKISDCFPGSEPDTSFHILTSAPHTLSSELFSLIAIKLLLQRSYSTLQPLKQELSYFPSHLSLKEFLSHKR